jgi:hypothetical protein
MFLQTVLLWPICASAQEFNVTNTNLRVLPQDKSWIFNESDSLTITDANSGTITIRYAMDNAQVYSGPSTNLHLPRGHYIVDCPGDRTQFVVVPDDYHGGSILGAEGEDGADSGLTSRLSRLKPKWARCMGPGFWSNVQSTPNTFDWRSLDRYVTCPGNAGCKFIVMAFWRPTWTLGDSPYAKNPMLLTQAYINYIAAMAARYGPQFPNGEFGIEVWNEPWYQVPPELLFPGNPGTNWESFVDNYVDFLRASYTAIKKANPNVKVYGPAWSQSNELETMRFVQRGAYNYLDAFTWHDYRSSLWAPDVDGPGHYPWRLDKQFQFHGSLMPGKPLLLDETGFFGQSALGIPTTDIDHYGSALSWQRGMFRTVKQVIMSWAGGAQALIPHTLALYSNYPDANSQVYGFEQSPPNIYQPRGPHPKTSAYLMTCYWLDGGMFLQQRVVNDKVFLYGWQRADGSKLVFAWSIEGNPVGLQLTGNEQIRDIYGSSLVPTQLTEEPLLFFADASISMNALLDEISGKLNKADYNLAPTLQSIDSKGVFTGVPLQFQITGSDPEGDPLTFSATELPPGAEFYPASRIFSWTPSGSQTGQYQVTFCVTDGYVPVCETITIYVYDPALPGRVALWQCGDGAGTILHDSEGSNNGTLSGFNFNAASGWCNSERGPALRFDGLDDAVIVSNANNQLLPADSAAFSIVFWFNPATFTNYNARAILCNEVYRVSGFRCGVTPAGRLAFWSGESGGNLSLSSTSVLAAAVWHHAVISYSGDGGKLYVDGQIEDSGTGVVLSNTRSLGIGSAFGSMPTFAGMLQEIIILNRALSPEQAQALYDSSRLNQAIPTNSPPSLVSITPVNTSAGQPVSFTVNASDADGDPLTFSASHLPAGATFDLLRRAFSWTPGPRQTGDYSINFTVSDGQLTDTKQASIYVFPSTQPPLLTPIENLLTRPKRKIQIELSATNPNERALTFSMASLPRGAKFNKKKRLFKWSPSRTQLGAHQVTASVSDGQLSDSKIFTITVSPTASP